MSRREFVLKNFHHLGEGNSKRLLKYAYAIKLSQFLEENKDKPKFGDRFLMYDYIVSELNLENRKLQYLEFGVFEGKSIKYWLSRNTEPASTFYGFDSFEGLPEDWFPGMGKGAFNVGGKLPNINDERVKFIKGWFNQTLPPFLESIRPDASSQIVLHLDADLYSSTYYVLNCLFFQGYIKKGTILVFDEAIVASIADTEFRAFYDFMQAMNIKYDVVAIAQFEMAVIIQ